MYLLLRVAIYPQYEVVRRSDVTVLDLSTNHLGSWTVPELKQNVLDVFALIPIHITTLVLLNNYLSALGVNLLQEAFSGIPENVVHLNVSNNRLAYFEGANDFLLFIKSIPKNITILNLRNNQLNLLPETVFERALGALSPQVRELDLSENNLFCLPKDRLELIFAAIPLHVTTLYLNDNEWRSATQLATVFKRLHPNIIALHLCNIQLNINSEAELLALFEAIPLGVKILNISNNNLHQKIKTKEQWAKILSILPVTVLEIIIDDEESQNYINTIKQEAALQLGALTNLIPPIINLVMGYGFFAATARPPNTHLMPKVTEAVASKSFVY